MNLEESVTEREGWQATCSYLLPGRDTGTEKKRRRGAEQLFVTCCLPEDVEGFLRLQPVAFEHDVHKASLVVGRRGHGIDKLCKGGS